MIRYTKDHIGNKLETTITKSARQINHMRGDVDLFGIPVPQYASDPSVPTALNGQVFIYYNTTSHVFRKFVSGSWSNAGI
jgi:hypothetical protein